MRENFDKFGAMRRRKQILVAMACLLLGAFVISGCGGDSNTGDGSGATGEAGKGGEGVTGSGSDSGESQGGESSPVSKAKFVAKANAVCRHSLDEIQGSVGKIFKKVKKADNPKTVRRSFVTDAIVPGLEGEVDALSKLEAPNGDEDQIEAIIEATEEMIGAAREDPEAFLSAPQEFEKASELARDYGIGSCGTVS